MQVNKRATCSPPPLVARGKASLNSVLFGAVVEWVVDLLGVESLCLYFVCLFSAFQVV